MTDQHARTFLCTIGDCNGIGAEVLIRAIHAYQHPIMQDNTTHVLPATFAIITHPRTWHEYMSQCGLTQIAQECRYTLLPCEHYAPVQFGQETYDAGKLAGEALGVSADLLLRARADAVITMPVSKHVLHKAGYNVPGQTEFYGQKAGVAEPLMMLMAGHIRVALVTIHIPLHRVAEQITAPLIVHRLRQLHQSLQNDFGCTIPRIAVLGLNPHAGEQGAIGTEEQTIIEPAIAQARSEGIHAEGAFPADGFFAKKNYKNFDGVLAMYHDQGLIPIKMLAGGHGVNFTAGLPFVRTSPDHGTAFDIAGKQSADPSAVLEAIHTAQSIAEHRGHRYS